MISLFFLSLLIIQPDEIKSIYAEGIPFGRVSFDRDGKISLQVNFSQGTYIDKRMRLLKEPSIRDEIELTQMQQHEISEFNSWCDEKRKEIVENWKTRKKQDAIRMLTDARKRAVDKLDRGLNLGW